MTFVEGDGQRPPGAVCRELPPGMRHLLRQKADERTTYRAYARRPDQWGRGFDSDAVYLGLVGEWAVCAYLGLPHETPLLPAGDGGQDIEAHGLRIQVKTRRRVNGENLIRRVDERRSMRPLPSDIYVFVQHDPVRDQSGVRLIGWEWRKGIRKGSGRLQRSRRARHFNLVIADQDLLPMCRLRDELAVKRAIS